MSSKEMPPSYSEIDSLIEKIEKYLGRNISLFERINLPRLDAGKTEKAHVYALEMDNGTVKIGVAKDVNKRANTVSHSSGLKVWDIYQTEPVANAHSIETACHKHFEKFRIHGEFFKISFADACAELDSHAEDIAELNRQAEEKYQRDVETAWENYRQLEERYSLPKSDLIVVENNQALTTSLIIAETFKKRHDNVLRDIRKLIDDLAQIGICAILRTPPASANSELSKLSSLPVFIESTYINKQNGQTYPQFLMNRNGFTLLAMGFTGTKALEWKLKYIDAFNRMEAALKGKVTTPKTEKPPKTKKEESVQLCLNFDSPEPPENKLLPEQKINLLMELVKLSPDDSQKIDLIDKISASIILNSSL